MCWFSLPSWLVASSRPIAPFSAVYTLTFSKQPSTRSGPGPLSAAGCRFQPSEFSKMASSLQISCEHCFTWNFAWQLPLRLVQDHIVTQKICNSLRIVVNRCLLILLVYVFSSLFIHSHFELANRLPHFFIPVPVQGSSQCGAAELRSQAIPLRPLPPPWHSIHLPCGVGLFLGWLRGKFPICHALNCSGTVGIQSFSCNYMIYYMCKKIFPRAFLVSWVRRSPRRILSRQVQAQTWGKNRWPPGGVWLGRLDCQQVHTHCGLICRSGTTSLCWRARNKKKN